jgi:hypothetical protein
MQRRANRAKSTGEGTELASRLFFSAWTVQAACMGDMLKAHKIISPKILCEENIEIDVKQISCEHLQ